MKKILLFTILFFKISVYAQNTDKEHLFFDENDMPIDAVYFYEKCNSFLYYCSNYEENNVSFNFIIQKYKFGKLNKLENKQIRLLLSKKTNQLLENKTIIISYKDLIYGFEAQKTLKENSSNDKHFKRLTSSKSKFESVRKRNDLGQKKCVKKLKNKNTIALYMYNINKGYNYTPKNFIWHKIPSIVKAVFFQKKSPSMLILKPDGQYFRYTSMTETYVNKFLKNDWELYIKDYNIALNSLQKRRNGFFKEISSFNSKQKFYIDKRGSNSIGRPNERQKVKLPPGTITVRNRAEISKYLGQNAPCYSYPSF